MYFRSTLTKAIYDDMTFPDKYQMKPNGTLYLCNYEI